MSPWGPPKEVPYGIFEANDISVVRKLVEDDVYWKQGIWTSLELIPGSRRPEPDQDPFGHELITIRAENIGVTTHLAAPFTGDGGQPPPRNAITLEGLQFEVFPTANDVAPLMWYPAVLFEQHCSRAVPNGSGCCFRTPRLSSSSRNALRHQRKTWISTGWCGFDHTEPGMPSVPLNQFIGRAVILRKRSVQSVQVIPANGSANGVEVASIRPRRRRPAVEKLRFQIAEVRALLPAA